VPRQTVAFDASAAAHHYRLAMSVAHLSMDGGSVHGHQGLFAESSVEAKWPTPGSSANF